MSHGQVLLERLKQACLNRGVSGIKQLGRAFRIFDDDRSWTLSLEEFCKGFLNYGVDMTEDEFRVVFSLFDQDQSGAIDYEEFLGALRPPLNEVRLAAVEDAFKKLDKNGDGRVTVEDLCGSYNVDYHPKFSSGELTRGQCLEEFLNTFDVQEHDHIVTKAEFISYYSGVSNSFDDDDRFVADLKNNWQL